MSLLTVGQSVGSIGMHILNKRFFPNLMAAIICALVSGLMVGALLVSLHYLAYLLLTNAGFAPLNAFLATMAIAAFVSAGFMYATVRFARRITNISLPQPKLNLQRTLQHPEEIVQKAASKVAELADAFFDGIMSSDPKEEAARQRLKAERTAERRARLVERRKQQSAEHQLRHAEREARKEDERLRKTYY